MTTFLYRAKNNTADTVSGQISAHTEEEAIDLINQLGLLPVSIEQQKDGKVSTEQKIQKVKSKELFVFSRQLANLLRSGVALLKSLTIIEEQTNNPYFRNVISNIRWGIKEGKTFAESLAAFPNIFSSLYVTLVNAGEESGNLQEMLVNVAEYQRRQEKIIGKVRTALAYPLLMAVVGAGTVYFILTFVIPKMGGLFENIGGNLPLPTVILLSISNILGKAGIFILAILIGVVFFGKRWIKTEQGKMAISRMSLRLPIFGEIILKTELARFSRTLVLLLRSGVNILKALSTATPTLNNELIKGQLEKCRGDLETGGSFGESLQESDEIPKMMGHLISVGEESGNLNDVLTEIADTYEQESNESIKLITTLLEPIMILAVGLVVGFIVFAMLLPIFQIDVLVG